MGIIKTLYESTDLIINITDQDRLMNGLSKKTTLDITYRTLTSLLGDPIQFPSGSEPPFAWVLKVSQDIESDPVPVAVVPDSHYRNEVAPTEMTKWSILANTAYPALLVKMGLLRPNQVTFNV